MPHLNIDEARYPLSEAAKATGWNLSTLRDYLARGKFEWNHSDERATVQGATSFLSFRSVLRLGLAFEFWTLGVSPKDAVFAAASFCDQSSQPKSNSFGIDRPACKLFAKPYVTLLLWKRGYNGQVIPLESGKITDVDELLRDPFNNAAGPVAVVKVDDVWRNIVAALKVED